MGPAIPSDLCLGCMEPNGGADTCPKCQWKRGARAESPLYLAPGTILKEQYVVGRCLGHGGFGITYLGWDLNLARRIAIKEYFPSGVGIRTTDSSDVFAYTPTLRADYDWGLERYLEEARVVAQFESHPNIVSVRNYFAANGTAYMVLEYLDGVTFEDFLARSNGKVNWDLAMRVMIPVMDALREVHRVGLLHRDISPDNIFVLWSGQVKVIDFGAARYSMGQHSKNLSVILKPGFAPPEQYETRGDQRAWTDVYATAGTIYRALTGEIPMPAPDRRRTPLPPPSKLGVAIDPGRERALMKALELEPEDRFATMGEFIQALREGLTDTPPPAALADTEKRKAAPPPLPPGRVPPPVPPKPVPPPPTPGIPKWLLGVAGGVLALVLLAILWPRGDGGKAIEVEYFRADQTEVRAGEPVELSWSVRNAETVQVNGNAQPATGRLVVRPTSETSYVLRAIAGEKSAERSVTIAIIPPDNTKNGDDESGSDDRPAGQPAEILSLSVSPTEVAANEQAILSWEVRNARLVKIGTATLPAKGTAPVRVQVSTRYTLRATGEDGRTVERQVVLTVRNTPPPKPPVSITRLEFVPSSIQAGGSAKLYWSTQNATGVTINGRAYAASGSADARPTQSMTATLVAQGPGGPVQQTATLTVQPAAPPVSRGPQITAFAANPVAANAPGQTITLFYSTRNAVRITIDPEVGNLTSTQGRVTVFPRQTTTYAMTAYDAAGQQDSRTIQVTVRGSGFTPPVQNTGQSWEVYHHHGSMLLSGLNIDFSGRNTRSGCYGTLSLSGGNLSFRSRSSNDGFNVGVSTLTEVEANTLRLGGHRTFHVKTRSSNYNFVPQQSVDAIIGAITAAMR